MFELGREQIIKVNGKSYKLSRLERRIIDAYRDWISEQIGDPFALVKEVLKIMGANLEPAYARELIEDAKEQKKQLQSFSLGCPLAHRFMNTEIGMGELFYLLLLDHQPDITRDEAFIVCREMASEVEKTLAIAQGKTAAEKNATAPAAQVVGGNGSPGTGTPSVAA